MHPCNPTSGLCSPIETINTLFLQFGFILQASCECVHRCNRLHIGVHLRLGLSVRVHLMFVCVNEWLGANVEVETAFGFGALLQREKK